MREVNDEDDKEDWSQDTTMRYSTEYTRPRCQITINRNSLLPGWQEIVYPVELLSGKAVSFQFPDQYLMGDVVKCFFGNLGPLSEALLSNISHHSSSWFCCSGIIPRLSLNQHSLYVGVVEKLLPHHSQGTSTERWDRNTLRVVTARVFYVLRGFLTSPSILNNSMETAA